MKKSDLNKKIGQRIVELRSKKAWIQSDLARAMNKDRQAIEKLENGKVNPTAYTLYEVAKALEVPLASLLEIKSDFISLFSRLSVLTAHKINSILNLLVCFINKMSD